MDRDSLWICFTCLFMASLSFCTGAELLNWGVTWKKHKRYEDIRLGQKELGLERGSKVVEFTMNDFSTLDFHIPADNPAITMQCYPQGNITGQ